MALNKFADMTTDEFHYTYAVPKVRYHPSLSGGQCQDDRSFMYADAENLPATVDWRQRGAVTGIKVQGHCGTCVRCSWFFLHSFRSTKLCDSFECARPKKSVQGSCWAFLTTVAVAGINKIRTGMLSEQELMDCDNTRNDGCGSRIMDYAFQFIHTIGGITTESTTRIKAYRTVVTCPR